MTLQTIRYCCIEERTMPQDSHVCSKHAHKVIGNPLFSNKVFPQSISMMKVTLSHVGRHTKRISGSKTVNNSHCEVKAHLNTIEPSTKVTSPKRSSATFASDFSKDSKTSMDRSAALFCYKTDTYC